MHRTLIDTLVETGGGAVSKTVAQGLNKFLMPGFVSSNYFIRVLLDMYVGGGYHVSIRLAEFDIPTTYNDLSGIIKMARTMLQVKVVYLQLMQYQKASIGFYVYLRSFSLAENFKVNYRVLHAAEGESRE